MNASRRGMWALIIVVILVIIGLLLMLAANGTSSLPPTTTQTQQATSTSAIAANYSCDSGKTIQASYLTASTATTTGNSVQLVLSDGRQMTLGQTLSADGARYSNGDPQVAEGQPGAETIVFWSKGNGAFMTENGTTTFNNCVASSQ